MLYNNFVLTGDNDDNISTGPGQDFVISNGGNDTIMSGTGSDMVIAGSGDDKVFGESAQDFLFGGSGNDELYGGEGNDWIFGGEGNDMINGGLGADKIFGGTGVDTFNYTSIIESSGSFYDIIFGFEHGTDLIDLSALATDGISSFSDITINNQGSTTTISGNNVDFFVQLQGGYDLVSADFLF